LFRSEIEWGGNRFVVGDGTVLERVDPPLASAYA
jgi:hypothetical protein